MLNIGYLLLLLPAWECAVLFKLSVREGARQELCLELLEKWGEPGRLGVEQRQVHHWAYPPPLLVPCPITLFNI